MSPWMYSSEEDVTDFGLVTPEYQEMAMEAQGMSEEDSGESESEGPETELLSQALSTIQTQSETINKLLDMMRG
jgi:hypothetical protein